MALETGNILYEQIPMDVQLPDDCLSQVKSLPNSRPSSFLTPTSPLAGVGG